MESEAELTFLNSCNSPLYLQVDPWANLYCIEPFQGFSIIACSDKSTPRFDIDWRGNELIVTIEDSAEFFVLQNGSRLHHIRDYRTNVDGF